MAEPVGWLRAVGVDAADLPRLAEFWQAVLGVGVVESAPDWIQLKPDRSSTFLAFEQAPDGQAPTGFRTRPDIEVEDLDVARARIEELGGRLVAVIEARPGEHHYRMADPEGNEFTVVLPPTPELVRETYWAEGRAGVTEGVTAQRTPAPTHTPSRGRIVIRVVVLVVTAVALYLVLPGPDRDVRLAPPARGCLPRVVRADLRAGGGGVRVHLAPDAHRAAHRQVVRHRVRAALRQHAEPCASRRRGHGRRHDVPDAESLGVRRTDREHRAHRRRPVVDGDAVRAADPRVAGDPVRPRGELGAAAGRDPRWRARDLPAHRRVDPARLRSCRPRRRTRPRLVRAPGDASPGAGPEHGAATASCHATSCAVRWRSRGSGRCRRRWATSCSTSSRCT